MNLSYLHERLDWLEPHWQLARAFMPAVVFDRLQIVAALRAEFWDLILIQDDQVMLRRMQWWLEEWQRVTEGAARHPLTQAVQELETSNVPDLRSALASMVSWRMGQIDASPPECLRPAARFLATYDGAEDSVDAWHGVLTMDMARRVDRLRAVGCSLVAGPVAAQLQLRNEDLTDTASYEKWGMFLIDRHFTMVNEATSFAWIFADLGRSAVMRRGAFGRTFSVWRMRRCIRFGDG